MSGHSKWASIKHQKAATDAKRGAAFTKVGNLISVSAKKGADPETNFALRLAIQKAKAANMPAANIERAIKRGAGLDGAAAMEEIMYEAYGPGGVAILIECATDNRNRTASDVRAAVTKYGGRMAELGSVAYLFTQKGVIEVTTSDIDGTTLAAIEAGADDIEDNGATTVTVYTAPAQLDAVRKGLVAAGLDVTAAELTFIPNSSVTVSEETVGEQLMRIMDKLDELDDVSETYANFEIDDAIADKLS
jgi:YebC/PmpR family DNA-binding regulatory protein